MLINNEGAKEWQKFGLEPEVMMGLSVAYIEKTYKDGGFDSDLVAISMTAAMSGLAKMRSKSIYAGDEKEFDEMLDRFHVALETLRINHE